MATKRLSYVEAGCEGITFEGILQQCLASSVLTIGSDGRILAATPEAKRLMGWTDDSGESHAVQDLPAPIRSTVREVTETRHIISDRQIELRAEAGKTRVAVTAIPLFSGDANGAVILVLKDFSAAVKLEKQIQRLDRLASIGTLSAGMAHEIKNALVAVRTFVDLLLEKNQEAELAGIVRREMTRVDSIIGQMLRFAAPAQPALAPVSLHAILDHALRLVQHRTADRLIRFNRAFDASKDSLQGDEHQLEQAFVNLLFNAVEAIGAEGSLTVATKLVLADATQLREGPQAPKSWRIEITDTGPGISPEHLPRVFEPFFTTKHHGTGLGLPVTRRIIEEHGGSIHVESQPGKGTTFVILLPAKLAQV